MVPFALMPCKTLLWTWIGTLILINNNEDVTEVRTTTMMDKWRNEKILYLECGIWKAKNTSTYLFEHFDTLRKEQLSTRHQISVHGKFLYRNNTFLTHRFRVSVRWLNLYGKQNEAAIRPRHFGLVQSQNLRIRHKFKKGQRGMEHLRWLCIIVRWLALKVEPSKHHGYRVLGSIGDTFCVDLVIFGGGPFRAKTVRLPLRLPLFWCAYFIFYAYVGYIRFAHTKFQLNNSSGGNNWQHQQQQKKFNQFLRKKTSFDIVTLRREKQWRTKWDHSTTNTLACAQCYFLLKILVYACVCVCGEIMHFALFSLSQYFSFGQCLIHSFLQWKLHGN